MHRLFGVDINTSDPEMKEPARRLKLSLLPLSKVCGEVNIEARYDRELAQNRSDLEAAANRIPGDIKRKWHRLMETISPEVSQSEYDRRRQELEREIQNLLEH